MRRARHALCGRVRPVRRRPRPETLAEAAVRPSATGDSDARQLAPGRPWARRGAGPRLAVASGSCPSCAAAAGESPGSPSLRLRPDGRVRRAPHGRRDRRFAQDEPADDPQLDLTSNSTLDPLSGLPGYAKPSVRDSNAPSDSGLAGSDNRGGALVRAWVGAASVAAPPGVPSEAVVTGRLDRPERPMTRSSTSRGDGEEHHVLAVSQARLLADQRPSRKAIRASDGL